LVRAVFQNRTKQETISYTIFFNFHSPP
jgi:hypothetical protein